MSLIRIFSLHPPYTLMVTGPWNSELCNALSAAPMLVRPVRAAQLTYSVAAGAVDAINSSRAAGMKYFLMLVDMAPPDSWHEHLPTVTTNRCAPGSGSAKP